MQQSTCPICEQDGVTYRTGFDRKGTLELNCPKCGTFCLTTEANEDLPSLPKATRRKMERYLYETRGDADRLLTSGTLPSDRWHGRMLSFENSKRLYQDDGSPLDKYENTIRRIASQAHTFGHEFSFPEDRWLVPTMDDEEAELILRALIDEGYLAGSFTTSRIEFHLTPLGIRFAAELASEAKTDSISVFIAACFNDELKEARDTIYNTLDDLGYKPRQVNREPHNELIDLKIYELIRESRFLVADLTCNRQSVYYEVGFAHGLGLEVVLTCNSDHMRNFEDEFKHVHFDLSHRNILEWTTSEELGEKLRSHIYQSFGAIAPSAPE